MTAAAGSAAIRAALTGDQPELAIGPSHQALPRLHLQITQRRVNLAAQGILAMNAATDAEALAAAKAMVAMNLGAVPTTSVYPHPASLPVVPAHRARVR